MVPAASVNGYNRQPTAGTDRDGESMELNHRVGSGDVKLTECQKNLREILIQ